MAAVPPKFFPLTRKRAFFVSLLLLSPAFLWPAAGYGDARRRYMKEKVRKMFYHAYDNYMAYAFPHDELKPLSSTYTDSLSELGNLKLEHLPQNYHGSALTLIESLTSLAVLGNNTEFEKGILWLADNLTFEVDARVSLFECNIRVLGGLLSAHVLATDSSSILERSTYKNQLLVLAEDLGKRFLRAFDTPTGLPYAWINLKTLEGRRSNMHKFLTVAFFVNLLDDDNRCQVSCHAPVGSSNLFDLFDPEIEYGVMENETTETSTSGCGSLILEMGALSRLTGNYQYENAALHALRRLWSMRSSLNLLGTTLDVVTGKWIEYSSGIGAGVDSFYEYLLKAYILFGSDEFWDMFHSAYLAVQKYFRHGPWYHEADMRSGKATYWQLTSLQAFWPGLQILVGDVAAANASHREFYDIWRRFGVLPERYLLDRDMLHPTERYYPLRPELAESTFYLYEATKDPWYMEVGESIVDSLNRYTKVKGGFASIRDVTTMQPEDHQHSFFLSETCKYLYLLYDDTFLASRNYIFTTEGHPLPIRSSWHEKLPGSYIPENWTTVKNEDLVFYTSSLSRQVCPATARTNTIRHVESACHVPDYNVDHRCRTGNDCGVDSTTCRQRTCSLARYCGLWAFID